MVSKNNQWQHLQASAQRLPHYGLRKLSVGVASVLLSTTLYMGVNAHADTVNSQNYEMLDSKVANNSNSNGDSVVNRGTNAANTVSGDSHVDASLGEAAVKNEANAKPQVTKVNNDNHMQSGAADANAKLDTKTSSNEMTSAVATETSPVSMLHSASSSSQGAVTAPVEGDASNKANNQVQPSSTTDAIQIKPVHRPVMRLAVATATNSDELIVGKDVTISDFSVTVAEGKNEFENAHANIKFTMHADNPSALAGKRLTIQLDRKIWDGFYLSKQQDSNSATISYQGHVIGTLNYGSPFYFVYITFNDDVKNYAKIDVQSDLVVAGISQHAIPYRTSLYTPTQAKDGQTYYLTDDVTIGQQKYSSNLPSVIHYYALDSQFVSSVTDVTTTSYSQSDSELNAGVFYKTPNGIYYSQSLIYGGNNLYSEQSGQSGYLEEPSINVGTDIVTDRTQSYTATFDIDQTKLSPAPGSKLVPTKSYYLTKYYWDDKKRLPNTSDVYVDSSMTYSSIATADATVTKNGVIFNKLNGQSLATRIFNIENTNSHATFPRRANYVTQNGKLYLTPALFKQLQAAAESDQNLTEALNTVKTTGWAATIKLANSIDTGLKVTIKTSDGKTKELPFLIDAITYLIKTASTAPKGAILVAAQGKTTKVYHPGDQNIPAVVDQSQLTKTITRTINVHKPGEKVTTIKQAVVMTQSVSVVDGKDVTYNGDWKVQGDSSWASYDAPVVPGYTVSQSYFAQQAVTDTTQDQTVNVTYTANEHQISIEYVDNATGQVVKTDHMTGKTGQTVSITPHVPDGWELVSGQSVPSEVTLGADGAPATVIKVQPQERSVAVKFVDDEDFNQQVGQAITLTGRDGDTVKVNVTVPDKYQLADGQQLPTTYTFAAYNGDITIHLTHKLVQREATVDVQMGLETAVRIGDGDLPFEFPLTITQNQWNQLDDKIKDHGHTYDRIFPLVKVGTLTGPVNYDLVDNKVVSFGDDWTTLNLGGHTYQMPDGTEVVNGIFVDYAPGAFGKSLKEEFLKYYPDTDPDYANRPWHGYLSVNATNNGLSNLIHDSLQAGLVGNEPNTLAKANGDQAVTAVKSANKTVDSNWLKGKFDTSEFSEQNGQLRGIAELDVVGIYVPYVEKTATRTINVTMPDGKTTAVKQTATLAKQVDFGKDAHPDWTTGEWTSYDVPTIPGYTASQLNVAKETVTGATSNQTVNITYIANPQTATVVYQTEDGTTVHTTTVNGQTGQTVKVSNEVPAGWAVTKGQVPSEITFGPDGTPQTVVTIAHQHVNVDPDHPQNNGTKLPDNSAKTFEGVEANDLNKIITRTIKVTAPDGKIVTTTQTAKLTRTADVDEVTGEVTYGKWTTGKWDAYEVSTVPGYTASQNEVPATEVTSDMTDQTVDINYTANSQTIHINYVDDNTGKIVYTTTVTGKTGETVSLNLTVPDKYQLADGQQLPTTYTFAAYNGDITIDLTHKVVQREAKIDAQIALMTTVYSGNDDDDEYLASVVTQNQWTHLDNEIKDSRNPNSDKLYPLVKVGTLTGHVNYDLVDNKVVSFGDDWTTLNLGGQTYQMPDGTEVVNGMFIKNDLTWGKTLKEELLKYHSDVDPDYINRPWHGYLSVNKTNMIVSDLIGHTSLQSGLVENEPNALAKAIGDQAATVVKMANKTVDSNWLNLKFHTFEFSEQNGQLRADGFLPVMGVYIPYVEKTATRTINVTAPDGKMTTVKQTVTLEKQVDLSKDAHPNWTTDEWTSYDVPTIPGYTASQSNVAKEAVTGTTKDQIVNITYTANPQSTTVNYVDQEGKIIHTTLLKGVTYQTVTVPNEVPDGWVTYNPNMPTRVVMRSSPVELDYLIGHQLAFVKATAGVKAGDLIPGTKTKTFNDQVNADKLVTHASYTVNIWADERHTRKLATNTYHTDFTRDAVVDAVTGDVYYYNWSEDGKHTFAGFTRQAGEGYQAVVAPAWMATPANPTKTVDLVAQPQQVSGTIQYQTADGTVVSRQTFTGDKAVTLMAPKGYTLMTNVAAITPALGQDQVYTVYVRPTQTLYTAADQLPAGVESLRKTVTRTIHITEANGHVRTITQRVRFTRTATVKADGSVVYSDWHATGRAVWNKVFLPKRHGYHLVIDGRMDKMNVTGAMSDVMVNVQYVKD